MLEGYRCTFHLGMLYVVHKDGNEDYVCTTDTIDFHAALRKEGAKVLKESQLETVLPSLSASDTVMIHVGLASDASKQGLKVSPARKALFTIDECKSDGVLFRTHREFCDEIDCREMILSYPSERNVKFLEEHGYKSIPYNPSITLRDRKHKKYDIIISGQMDRNYYPTRVHVAETILRNKNRWRVVHLPHPGFELSKARHQYTGEKYRELLDECSIGVACKAGWRDRLVAKYVELGASWCLPIGDAPSYMDPEMVQSMIHVDADTTEEVIIRKIDEALESMDERLSQYVSAIKRNHDLTTNVKQLARTLSER